MSNPDYRWWEPAHVKVQDQPLADQPNRYQVKPVIRYGELPEDMQQLILDLLSGQSRADNDPFDAAADSLTPTTMFRQFLIPVERFPRWEVGIDNDPRGLEHVEEMMHTGLDKLPPVVVYDNMWLDGRHRVAAHYQMNYGRPGQQVRVIDLQDAMLIGIIPKWIKCCCKKLNPV